MAERILIWGAGAIGGSVGAWLKRAGHDITFVDVVAEHVAAIRGAACASPARWRNSPSPRRPSRRMNLPAPGSASSWR